MMIARPVHLAGAVLGLQGLGLLVATGVQVQKLVTQHVDKVSQAVGVLVLSLLGAATLAGLGYAIAQARGWARSPVIVVQILAVLVGLSLFGQHQWGYGMLVLGLAVVELGLLATPDARTALGRD
ncbi:MAG: hypothetical protein ACJ73S_12050 [Mycobacteriales bacterium]